MRILEVATLSKFFDWFLLPLVDRLRETGWEVDGLARGATADIRSAPHFDQVFEASWSRHPLDLKGIVPMLRRINELVEDRNYDVVHVHTPVAAFYTRLALWRQRRRRDLKIVYTAHGFHFHRAGHPVRNAVFLASEWLAGKVTDALVVINEDDARAARRFSIVPDDRLHYMRGIGVDTTLFDRQSVPDEAIRVFREELGLNQETPVILCAAELIRRKRHADLLEAFGRIERSDAHLLVAGSGPLGEALERQAVALGMSERVHFLGHRHDMPTLIAAAAVVVLVSEQEGLPRCLLEALSMGTPVIATAIRGSSELVGDNGVLVPVGDVAAITAALDWILADPDTARQRAERVREHMLHAYDQESIFDAYERLFDALTSDKRFAE